MLRIMLTTLFFHVSVIESYSCIYFCCASEHDLWKLLDESELESLTSNIVELTNLDLTISTILSTMSYDRPSRWKIAYVMSTNSSNFRSSTWLKISLLRKESHDMYLFVFVCHFFVSSNCTCCRDCRLTSHNLSIFLRLVFLHDSALIPIMTQDFSRTTVLYHLKHDDNSSPTRRSDVMTVVLSVSSSRKSIGFTWRLQDPSRLH